ncbi:50S ribosomal protein L16 [Candidatus Woesearchaeota archaeon]|nr:50S ribosomal protein L16 [Candidatus Woesearchaeota archaeon]
MARIRKFVAYRRLERPYTRTSKYKEKSYIRMNPNLKITKFETGSSKKKFQYILTLNSKIDLQIRDNALESARQTSNKLLETNLGLTGFHMKVKVYPYHVLREHALAAGAGADRFSSGMAHAFGKPMGNAARIKRGQTIFEISVDKANLDLAKRALEKAATKLPCTCSVLIAENKLA